MTIEIQHGTLSEKTYRKLKSLIQRKHFAPGERLKNARLAKEMGVSITPLREALTRLEREGFVVTIPRRGTFIAELSPDDINEVYDIREMLEALAASLASRTATQSDIENMREAIRMFEESLGAQDVRSCIRNDFKFHEYLVAASGNRRLMDMVESYHIQISSILSAGPGYLGHAPDYLREHLAVVEAIALRDGERAEALIRAHIRKGKQQLQLPERAARDERENSQEAAGRFPAS